MRHHNSVLHGLLKHVPWSRFDELVEEHGADARARKLSTKSQFVALLYGQLAGAVSLREIETAMASHSARFYHLGAREVSRSTLADANAGRSHEVFTGLLRHMAGALGRGFRRQTAEAVRLIDSTGVRLAGMASQWARFSKGVAGAKAHIIYDPDAEAPLYLEVTPAKVNDITAAQAMPIEPYATYVFDLGYYHYAWWARLDAAGCRIVTRLKKNTPLALIGERALPQDSPLLYDRIGRLPERLSSTRQNPFQRPVREIGVTLDDGKILRVVTNDLFAPAQEIADLYKRRWAIELFFRWVKQTLKISHFLGRSENAVRIQIACALIAYLLLRLANQASKITDSPLAFARLVRANLMHRRALDQLTRPPPPSPTDPRQLTLDLRPA
ncbi:MAG: IS4 family transposase [Gammaproteobacteria bacterium]|nr:IS4 family transposase [Gammaproteobacteria bacterium]